MQRLRSYAAYALLPDMARDNALTHACERGDEVHRAFDVCADKSLADLRSDAVPRPSAGGDHLQRFDQCL